MINLLVFGDSTGQRQFLKDIRPKIIMLVGYREFSHMAVGHALPRTHLAREQPLLFTSVDPAWKIACWYSPKISCCDLLAVVEEPQLWIKEFPVKRQRVL